MHRKPDWLRVRMPGGERYKRVLSAVSGCQLNTVCEEAHCPNIGECWDSGTATFMILGNTCSRGCRFCAVTRGNLNGIVDKTEPSRVRAAAERMELDYVVITSVTRDDLPDGGASIFAETVAALKGLKKPPRVELLTPDYWEENLETVINSKPDVFAHNIEVVERLTPSLRHRCFSYSHSLRVLAKARELDHKMLTKSSIMLGIGETDSEIESAMTDLRSADVNILVLGQYLQPTKNHAPVAEYIAPERFAVLRVRGIELGFDFVAAGPLVRTSYKAAEAFARKAIR
ncbi:MAG: lipoyl synthase [Proteobacteria bacterium]|nr:lipoyl synthase [Pseudomonadota bacterium]